jgi:hypothetical protein
MTKPKAAAFTKEQLLSAQRFTQPQKDVLRALLNDDETYTVEQATTALTAFLEKEAK